MLAATIDVGDVFPRAQRLDGHKLGGFPMVWFHLATVGEETGPGAVFARTRGQAPTAIA